MSNCGNCEKWKSMQKEILQKCDSVFDAQDDMISFEEDCIKTCPYLKEIVDNSGN